MSRCTLPSIRNDRPAGGANRGPHCVVAPTVNVRSAWSAPWRQTWSRHVPSSPADTYGWNQNHAQNHPYDCASAARSPKSPYTEPSGFFTRIVMESPAGPWNWNHMHNRSSSRPNTVGCGIRSITSQNEVL